MVFSEYGVNNVVLTGCEQRQTHRIAIKTLLIKVPVGS